MRAAAFVKNIVLIAACLFSGNVLATELNRNLDPTLNDAAPDSPDGQGQHDQRSPGMMDQSGDDWFAVALAGVSPQIVDTQVRLQFDEGAASRQTKTSGHVQGLIASYKAQTHTDVLTGNMTELLARWRAFLQDNHIGFSIKSHSWAIGGLVN